MKTKTNFLKGRAEPDATVAVMFSGGLDSLYQLDLLLKETPNPILAYNLTSIDNDESRAALPSVLATLAEMKRTRREFEVVVRPVLSLFSSLYIHALFALGGYSHRKEIPYYMMGECKEESKQRVGLGVHERTLEAMAMAVGAGAFAPIAVPTVVPQRIPWADCDRVLRRRGEIEYIGNDIASMAFWCFTPRRLPDGEYQDCGKCKKCIDLIPLYEHLGIEIRRPPLTDEARAILNPIPG